MATCYRHPSRETGVSCSNCGRPICPDCMTTTPVGMRCPECAKQRTRVHTMRNMPEQVTVTNALIAINVFVYLLEISTGSGGLSPSSAGSIYIHGALFGPSIRFNHEYWRLITGGFLHASIIHIGFNMYLLYVLGRMLEPAIGPVRFGAVYFVSLLAGSMGALVLDPNIPTIGASGAVFGLMAAAVVEMRARGIDPMQSGIPLLIVFNLVLSFTLANVSVGGHIGGLIGGALAALAIQAGVRRRSSALGLALCAVLAVGFVAGAIVVAQSSGSIAG
jgi:membrane associated rhomboid family serine protease